MQRLALAAAATLAFSTTVQAQDLPFRALLRDSLDQNSAYGDVFLDAGIEHRWMDATL